MIHRPPFGWGGMVFNVYLTLCDFVFALFILHYAVYKNMPLLQR